MKHFLEQFLHVTRYYESPTSYFEWAAYTTIAAVLRDNVIIYLDSLRQIYPNMYVLLIADAAETRKSTPLKASLKILKPVVNTKLIEGRASIQGVLQKLQNTVTVNGKVLKGASGLLYCEELAAFFVKDPSLTEILTDIYDNKDEFEIVLKSNTDIYKLSRMCVSILGATNAIFLRKMFSDVELYGGLVSRTILVIEEKARFRDSGLYNTVEDYEWDKLTKFIEHLSHKKGHARLTEEAKSYYDQWYMAIDFTKNSSHTGFEGRIGTHVLKLALAMAACEPTFDLLIEKRHIEQAIDKMIALTPNYKKLTMTVAANKTTINQAVTEITMALIKCVNMKAERTFVIRSLLGKVDIDTFDIAVRTLEQGGMLKQEGINSKIWLALTDKAAIEILGAIKGRPN